MLSARFATSQATSPWSQSPGQSSLRSALYCGEGRSTPGSACRGSWTQVPGWYWPGLPTRSDRGARIRSSGCIQFLGDAVATAGYSMSIEPEEHSMRWQQDDFGNTIARVTIPNRVSKFAIGVHLVADVREADRALPCTSEPLGQLPYSYPDATRAKLGSISLRALPLVNLSVTFSRGRPSCNFQCEFAASPRRQIRRSPEMQVQTRAQPVSQPRCSGSWGSWLAWRSAELVVQRPHQ